MSYNQEADMYSRRLEKAQKELKDKDDLIIILKMKLNGSKEKVKELEDQLAKKADEEITQHKEELKSERFFSSKFELQAMRGFPTGKEWYYLVKEHLKTQKQRKVKL